MIRRYNWFTKPGVEYCCGVEISTLILILTRIKWELAKELLTIKLSFQQDQGQLDQSSRLKSMKKIPNWYARLVNLASDTNLTQMQVSN